MLLLKAAWGASRFASAKFGSTNAVVKIGHFHNVSCGHCFTLGVVFQFPLGEPDSHCETDGDIVNHLSRHESGSQNVVCMGSDVRYMVESSFLPKTWGIDSSKFPDGNIEINMNHGSDMNRTNRLIPIQRFCTRPRFYPPPRADAPSEGSR